MTNNGASLPMAVPLNVIVWGSCCAMIGEVKGFIVNVGGTGGAVINPTLAPPETSSVSQDLSAGMKNLSVQDALAVIVKGVLG
jgi:hypothetical protein